MSGRARTGGRRTGGRSTCAYACLADGSLRRLGFEQIPLYQFHRPDPNVPLEDSLGTLVDLKAQGKIRHIGICNVDEAQRRRAAEAVTVIVSVQNRYNASDRSSESMIDLCEQEQITFLPWAPIRDLDGNPVVQQIVAAHGATSRQVALAWLMARSSAVLPIPGTGSVDHLDTNLEPAAGLDLPRRPRSWR